MKKIWNFDVIARCVGADLSARPAAISVFLTLLLSISLTHCLYSETTFEPFVGYNSFQKIGDVNRLIDNYSSIYVPAQFSEIKGGWDYGGKFALGLIKDKLLVTAKVSYLMAATGLIYTNKYGATITEGTLDFFTDNYKIRLLKGQIGLDFIPIQKQKVAVGLSASTGPGLSKFIVEGTGSYYDADQTSTFTYTYSIPYERQANVFDVALNVEFKPFGTENSSSFGTETEPFPLRSTSLELSVGSSFAPMGTPKSTRNIDFNGNGIMDANDIKKGDTLKKTNINVGDDLKLDLSSIFINLGIKLRW